MAMVAPSAAICASARSTKITPRSTTCTPKYAWIPVRIKLAAKAHFRNSNISMYSVLLLGLVVGLYQQGNVVIEKFKVVRRFRYATHGWRQHKHASARLA